MPECIKYFLESTGYDTINSLLLINDEKISEIEDFIGLNYSNTDVINTLSCGSNFYKNQTKFALLPGHRSTIKNLPILIKSISASKREISKRKNIIKQVVSETAEKSPEPSCIIIYSISKWNA